MQDSRKVILHMIDTTGPGGAETVLVNVVSRLDPAAFESTVLLTGGGWLHDTMQAAGITPVIAKTSGAFDWRFLREIVRIIHRRKIDLVHAHLPDASTYACLAGLLTGTPVVVTFHGMVGTWTVKSQRNRMKMAIIRGRAKRIITVSDHLKNDLVQNWSFLPERITRIYNGVDFDSFDRSTASGSLRAEFGIPPTATLVAAVGNIRPAKGYTYLLEAARKVIDSADDTYFLIAGQGHERLLDDLTALRASLGLKERVILAGFRDDIPELLKQCDIFVLSSTTEGLSIATIEAMGLGKPVVVTDSGGPAEIVDDGKTGLLVPPRDAEALAQGLLQLVTDREKAQALGAAAKSAVRSKFNLEGNVWSYAELYRASLV